MKEERIEFTPEMKSTHKILIPMMLPIHFGMIAGILRGKGYDVEVLSNDGRQIVDEGLKNVHNDTCYPALLVIGQMIDALKSGKYDINKVALIITQTGGGCRASNYLFLLYKALKQSGFENVPVIPLNIASIANGKNPLFTKGVIIKVVYALIYGDMLMWISNQCKPYEITKGETQNYIDKWVKKLTQEFEDNKFFGVAKNYKEITSDFMKIKRSDDKKIKVTIVGEIYMKYSPIGNNHLEDFLLKEGAEPILSSVLDFIMYCLSNSGTDYDLYATKPFNKFIGNISLSFLGRWQNKMIKAIKTYSDFEPPTPFMELRECCNGFIDRGAKMGEGWLLTSEMIDSVKNGVNNIVCTQPFGCLPNHIVAKGMMRKIKDAYPCANIVAIDYDPSATAINQENRLKLMLSNAKLTEKLIIETKPKITWNEAKFSSQEQIKMPVKSKNEIFSK
ncbi:MAG: 2-hydroxyacyl-CoA dehydratase [Oscillospiraceae bacterium]